ncbi:hypothetical protein BHYA_0003g00480 [Botrytis hyacinthi]|uniref:Uncharacterized protein n=1 Tax=Botrytis hyacinthi TaxID=278943 RepID=A0A4Z1H1K5_9HELO|nr:hypothetical protein BHYA_0003g00480 [Botrytis hyacinthi]
MTIGALSMQHTTCGFEADCPGIAKTRIEIIRWKFEYSRKERSADFMGARKRKCKLVSGAESPSEIKTDGRYKENELAITETDQFKNLGRRYIGDGTWKLELGTMEEKIKNTLARITSSSSTWQQGFRRTISELASNAYTN